YLGSSYFLSGDRQSKMANSSMVNQRGHGLIKHWYYWLDAHYDSTTDYFPLQALLSHWDNEYFNLAMRQTGQAMWKQRTEVTQSVPSMGPVEERDILGVYQSVFLSPISRQVLHTTSNGRFGQTWVETFEDMSFIRQYNGQTD